MKRLFLFLGLVIYMCQIGLNQDRNLLQNKAKEIDLENILIKDFSELNFPTYYNRYFWNNVPANIRAQYINNAEQYLDYDWPVVKATDYLEIICSGSRNSHAYAAPLAAMRKRVVLIIGKLKNQKS